VKTGRGVRQGCCLLPIICHLYSEYLTAEALEGFGVFTIRAQVICTMIYADDRVLLAQEETVLQDITDRLTESGRCYGMEMNVEKTKAIRISRHPSPIQIMIDQKQQEILEYFNYLHSMITNNARSTHEIKSRIAIAKVALNKSKAFHTSKLDTNLRKKLVNLYT
jgi:hypothetical protein